MPLRYFPILDTSNANIHFTDDWGTHRSGGRTHKGNDLFATKGTPVVAVDDGKLVQIADGYPDAHGNSGLSFHLTAQDGTFYYGTHLDAWEGPSRTVLAGDVIGYVGHSGNANDLPISYRDHLHFEIHPNGGPAIDPYPILMSAPRLVSDKTEPPSATSNLPSWAVMGIGIVVVVGTFYGARYAMTHINRGVRRPASRRLAHA